tara:strand:- start:10382 stop:10834 length:453 start_codon:yes stop_codon:yes gene_type:complete
MKSKVKIIKKPKDAIKEIERMAKTMRGPNSVVVGLPKGANDYPDGTSVIMVGTIHEFGSDVRNIPQRSFLRSTVQEKRRKYKVMFKKLAKKIIDGTITSKQALQMIGLQVESDVKDKITDIKEPELKSREGNPLVDTGHLRQSITHEVIE